MQGSPPDFLLGCRVNTVLEEDSCQIQMIMCGCQMQRSPPAFGCQMQRNPLVFLLGCRVGPMLEEDPCQI
jgi:hypothetical protein